MKNKIEKYDLYLVRPVRIPVEQETGSIVPDLLKQEGWLHLEDSFDDAREKLKIILAHKGNAYLVPVIYRTPLISSDEARRIAKKQYEEYKRRGDDLGPLSEVIDDFLWWTFEADDKSAIAEGIIPGVVRISIDKLDAHLCTQEEYAKWIKLSVFDS